MRTIVAAVAFSAILAGASLGQAPAGSPSPIEVRVDSRAAREILLTLARPKFEPTDSRLLEDIPAIALSIHDAGRNNDVFERDLRAAFDPESRVAVFDFRAVRDSLTRWQAFVAGVTPREAEIAKMAVSHAMALLPGDAPAGAKLSAHLSFGLAGLADNIVARSPDGGETMVIDLARALGDSDAESLDARIARLSRLIAGSAFRQAWGNYRANSPAWKHPEPELGPYEPLMRIVAEAGPVALYAVDESFFPLSTWLKGMGKKAFYDLERAATGIAESETELDKRVEVMAELKRADFARRVVAPAGMFLADGIRVGSGPDALRAALAGGPRAFFVAYDHASQKNKDLLPLPKLLKDRLSAAAKPAPKS